jgi:hypothetical protein
MPVYPRRRQVRENWAARWAMALVLIVLVVGLATQFAPPPPEQPDYARYQPPQLPLARLFGLERVPLDERDVPIIPTLQPEAEPIVPEIPIPVIQPTPTPAVTPTPVEVVTPEPGPPVLTPTPITPTPLIPGTGPEPTIVIPPPDVPIPTASTPEVDLPLPVPPMIETPLIPPIQLPGEPILPGPPG